MSSVRKTPWQHLSRLEQSILAPKIIDLANVPVPLTDEDLIRAGEFFNTISIDTAAGGDPLDPDVFAPHILTARNLMAQCGAYRGSPLWKMITRIHGFRKSYIELTVSDRDALLDYLREQNFVINREFFWSIHKHDSARARTASSSDPSLHFANDRANEANYGPNYFFVHWDSTSVWFGKARGFWRFIPGGRYIEGLFAGLRHEHGFASPDSVETLIASTMPGSFAPDVESSAGRSRIDV
jgi:hypothetical protein